MADYDAAALSGDLAWLSAPRLNGGAAMVRETHEATTRIADEFARLTAERDAANERAAEYAQDIRDHKAATLHYRRLVMKQRRGERVEVSRDDLDGLLSDQQFDLRHWRLEAEQATQKRCDLERDLRAANERADELEGLLRKCFPHLDRCSCAGSDGHRAICDLVLRIHRAGVKINVADYLPAAPGEEVR